MTTNRLLLLLAVLLGGLGSVFLLPREAPIQPVGIKLQLPQTIGGWWGEERPVTERERSSLGEGTEFSKMAYRNGLGDEVNVIIVLSGSDMNTSIHRPERCLPSQGWTVIDNAFRDVALGPLGSLGTTRLSNVRTVTADNGSPLLLRSLAYYWFVGSSSVTNSHLRRTWIDFKDRLFHGYSQRWAYITASATITDNLTRFGRDEKATDVLLQEFISELVPQVHRLSATSP